MATPVATNLSTLLQAIVTQFTTVAPLNQYSCFMSANPDVLDPEIADSQLIIKPVNFDVDQRTLVGGSNTDLYIIGQFEAWIHARLDLDAGNRGDQWLSDAQLGILPIIDCMVAAMNMFQVINGSNILTPVPIRLLNFGNIQRNKTVPEWGMLRTTWHLEFWQQIACGISSSTSSYSSSSSSLSSSSSSFSSLSVSSSSNSSSSSSISSFSFSSSSSSSSISISSSSSSSSSFSSSSPSSSSSSLSSHSSSSFSSSSSSSSISVSSSSFSSSSSSSSISSSSSSSSSSISISSSSSSSSSSMSSSSSSSSSFSSSSSSSSISVSSSSSSSSLSSSSSSSSSSRSSSSSSISVSSSSSSSSLSSSSSSSSSSHSSSSSSSSAAAPSVIFAAGNAGTPDTGFAGFPWTGSGIGTQLTSPTTPLDGGCGFSQATGIAWSPSGNNVLMSEWCSPYLVAYSFSGGAWGSQYTALASPLTGPSYSTCCAWSPDGNYVALGVDDFTSGHTTLAVYNWSSGFGSQVSNGSAFNPTNGEAQTVSWSPNGQYLLYSGYNSSTGLAVWNWSSGFGSFVSNPGGGTVWNQKLLSAAWHPSGNFISLLYPYTHNAGSGFNPASFTLNMYSFTGGAWVSPIASSVANSDLNGVNYASHAWNPAGTYCAIVTASSPWVYVYPWNGSTLGSAVANPSTAPSAFPYKVKWSADGNEILLSSTSTSTLEVYSWTGTGFGTHYAAPASYGGAYGVNASGGDYWG